METTKEVNAGAIKELKQFVMLHLFLLVEGHSAANW